jgi:glucosamine--fructose-6-phosphate aminotransferase (isomerizing)
LPRLRGAFALAFLFEGESDLMIGARKGSPLAVGYGDGEMYLGSDAIALAPFTDTIRYLEDGDWAVLTRTASTSATRRAAVERAVVQIARVSLHGRQGQLTAISWRRRSTSSRRSWPHAWRISRHGERAGRLPVELPFDFRSTRARVDLGLRHRLLCGLVAKYWFERLPGCRSRSIRVRVPLPRGADAPGGLAIFVSQSGETADTLASLRYAKEQAARLSVVNVRPRRSRATATS